MSLKLTMHPKGANQHVVGSNGPFTEPNKAKRELEKNLMDAGLNPLEIKFYEDEVGFSQVQLVLRDTRIRVGDIDKVGKAVERTWNVTLAPRSEWILQLTV